MSQIIMNVSADKSENGIRVEWQHITTAIKYAVYRKDINGHYELLDNKIENDFFEDTMAQVGETYQYAVKYLDTNKWSEPFVSNIIIDSAPEISGDTVVEKKGYSFFLPSILMEKLTLKNIFFAIGIIIIFYIGVFSNSEYKSQTHITLKETSMDSSSGGLMTLLVPNVSNKLQNVKIVETFLYSKQLFEKINSNFDYKKYLSSSKINFYDRVSRASPIEKYLDLYKSKLSFIYDIESDVITIDFYHTNPKIAQEILSFINNELEILINTMNQRIEEKKLLMVDLVIQKSKEEYEKSKKTLEAFQNKYKTISPKEDLLNRLQLVIGLEQQIDEVDNKIKEKQVYLNKDNYELKDLQEYKGKLETKLETKLKNMIGVNKESINAIINSFEELKANLELNVKILEEAQVKKATTRIELQKEKVILQEITQPSLGEIVERPKMFQSIFLTMILSFMLFFITKIIITIIKEK